MKMLFGMIALMCVAAAFTVCQIQYVHKINRATQRLVWRQVYIEHLERMQSIAYTDARCEELRDLIRKQEKDMRIE